MKSYDVIMAGAGSIGIPTALALAKRGLKVLVLERAASPGQGSNKAAIGGVRATHSDPAKILLCQHSLEIFSTWQEQYGDDIEWHPGGYCFVAYRRQEEATLKGLLAVQKGYGLDIDWHERGGAAGAGAAPQPARADRRDLRPAGRLLLAAAGIAGLLPGCLAGGGGFPLRRGDYGGACAGRAGDRRADRPGALCEPAAGERRRRLGQRSWACCWGWSTRCTPTCTRPASPSRCSASWSRCWWTCARPATRPTFTSASSRPGR